MTRLRPIAFALDFAGFIRLLILRAESAEAALLVSPSSTGKPVVSGEGG